MGRRLRGLKLSRSWHCGRGAGLPEAAAPPLRLRSWRGPAGRAPPRPTHAHRQVPRPGTPVSVTSVSPEMQCPSLTRIFPSRLAHVPVTVFSLPSLLDRHASTASTRGSGRLAPRDARGAAGQGPALSAAMASYPHREEMPGREEGRWRAREEERVSLHPSGSSSGTPPAPDHGLGPPSGWRRWKPAADTLPTFQGQTLRNAGHPRRREDLAPGEPGLLVRRGRGGQGGGSRRGFTQGQSEGCREDRRED